MLAKASTAAVANDDLCSAKESVDTFDTEKLFFDDTLTAVCMAYSCLNNLC
jgi:hypothetical protein